MRTRLLPWLQLCRAANVFTAFADIFAGWFLTHAHATPIEPWPQFLLLLVTSGCLYTAGMVWNDIFDREIDAQERPHRPIPSGRVPLKQAQILGGTLFVIALGTALAVGRQSLIVAGLLLLAVLVYDGFLKRTPLGPLGMGLCRLLNLLLGASAANAAEGFELPTTLAAIGDSPPLFVAFANGAYITGVTWFARQEATTSNRFSLAGAIVVINIGLGLLMAFAAQVRGFPGDLEQRRITASLLLLVITLSLDRRLALALFTPTPKTVQGSIKILLMSLVLLDAIVVLLAQPATEWAVVVAALLLPTYILARFIPMT